MQCGACGQPAAGVFGNQRAEFDDVRGTPICQLCGTQRVACQVAHKIRFRRGDFRATRYDRMQWDEPFTEDPLELLQKAFAPGVEEE